jgi:hypothetical protein
MIAKRPSNFSGGLVFKTGRANKRRRLGHSWKPISGLTEPKLSNLRGCGKGAASGVAQT